MKELKEQSRNENEMVTLNCVKLSKGMVVRNYKEMCILLDEPQLEGNSKKYQLKHWECYFDYDKQGQKFIINEIFDEPYSTIDARKQKEGIYVKYIELLLMEYLMQQEGKTASLTKTRLYEMLGMVSPDFYVYRNRKGHYMMSNELKCKVYTLNSSNNDLKFFYQRVDQKLNSILTSALRSMANRFLIHYQTEYIISYDVEVSDGTFIKEERVATDSEIRLILDSQHTVMSNMGFKSISEIFIHGKMKEYFNTLDDYVKENFDWNYVYSHIKIIYLENEIKRQIPIKAEEIRRLSTTEKRLGLNSTVADSLDTQIQNKYDKIQKEVQETQELIEELFKESDNKSYNDIDEDNGWGEPNPFDNHYDSNSISYSKDFVDIQKQLTNYLVRIKKMDSKME